ncbi:helix-turn-helix transcriptional regulator [bacterium]|nr:helix-turn-helix transcriptional regulator [bacterium]
MASGNKEFGKRIKELRESRKLTQEQLAELMGLDYQSISRIETGVYFTNYENLNKFANVFNVQIKDLFDYGHIQTAELLKLNIKNELDILNSAELSFLYKILQSLKELKSV